MLIETPKGKVVQLTNYFHSDCCCSKRVIPSSDLKALLIATKEGLRKNSVGIITSCPYRVLSTPWWIGVKSRTNNIDQFFQGEITNEINEIIGISSSTEFVRYVNLFEVYQQK